MTKNANKQSRRVTNSFSPAEVEVMCSLLERAMTVKELNNFVRNPAFTLVLAKAKRMRDQVRAKQADEKETAHAV